jgi:hypothetical protein
VVAQVALSMVLIVAAGLLVGTFGRLATLPLGFDADRVLIVNVDVTRAPIDPSNRIPFFHQLVAAVAAVLGVARAGGSMATPVGGGSEFGFVDPPGAPAAQPEPGPVPFWNARSILLNQITPGWLATYATVVLAGRDVNAQDTKGPPGGAGQRSLRAEVRTRPEPDRRDGHIPGRHGSTKDDHRSREDAAYLSARDGVRPTVHIPLAQREPRGPAA